MRLILLFFAFISLFGCNNNPQESSKEAAQVITSPEPIDKQLILVTAQNSETHLGEVAWYEYVGQNWVLKGGPVSCTLGKHGMAWGLGLHENPPNALLKKEGDGKTPKGIFNVGKAFGYANKGDFAYPYAPITEFTQCIEDAQSTHYNKIIDRTKVEKDYENADDMLRKDHLYKLGFFVEHNVEQKAGAGSCIFFHLYRTKDKPTAGCTGMDEDDLRQLLSWMDVDKGIKLVQVAKDDLVFIRKQVDLP